MRKNWLPIIALTLGILNLCSWAVPYFGGPLALTGIVVGGIAYRSSRRNIALVGLILSSLGLLLAVLNALVGVYGVLW